MLGLLVGHHAAESIGSKGSYLGGGLLVAVGLYALIQARRETTERAAGSISSRNLVLSGAALGIDNLVVGFALGAYNVPLILAVVVIAVVSVGMSLVGLEIGRRLGHSVEQWSAELGGAVLILVGILVASGVL